MTMTREEKNQLWRIPLIFMVVAGIVYFFVFLFTGNISVVNEIAFYGEVKEEPVVIWSMQLPFAISRLWDIFFIGLFVFLFFYISYYFKKIFDPDEGPSECFFIGILVIAAFSLVGVATNTGFTIFFAVILCSPLIVFFVAMQKKNNIENNILFSSCIAWIAGFLLGFKTGFVIGFVSSIIVYSIYSVISNLGWIVGLAVRKIFPTESFSFLSEKIKKVSSRSLDFINGK